MTDRLHTVLLFALPASGKSEVRTYLDSGTFLGRLGGESPVGPTLQLDDYPYVHAMHRIDDELKARGYEYVFYQGPDRPFRDPYEWGTLMELLNEDYDDLLANRVTETDQAAQLLMDRLDAARTKVGLDPVLGTVPYRDRCDIAAALEAEARDFLGEKNRQCAQELAGRTIFVEAARGGAHGAAMPLVPPRGYAYALSKLSDRILDHAVVLYIRVDPAESRRKNRDRGRPNAQGSILHHMVPLEVMLGEYGCDDMDHLLATSSKPDHIQVDRLIVVKNEEGEERFAEKTWHLPAAAFDNRADLTTFVRRSQEPDWPAADVDRIHRELLQVLAILKRGWETR
ncbi:MAG: hypothetical protein FJ098_05975 [Deltaproteobacteria bacterium]|nr:hypothetical protein [Deltaproteobacteria bacterium]